jgi:hypothetical protein
MPRVSVAEVILHGPEICGLTFLRPAASAACLMKIIDGLAGLLRPALGYEEPGEFVLSRGQIALDGAELVAAMGCSTESEPLSRSTHKRERCWIDRVTLERDGPR